MEEKFKAKLCSCLHKILADLRLLTIKTQMYHWNVLSENFFSLHKMLQKQYEKLFSFQDEVAENIRKIGYNVDFNYIEMDSSNLPCNNMNETDCCEIINNLLSDYNVVETYLKYAIEVSSKTSEEAVLNDLAKLLGYIQKQIWVLKSHL